MSTGNNTSTPSKETQGHTLSVELLGDLRRYRNMYPFNNKYNLDAMSPKFLREIKEKYGPILIQRAFEILDDELARIAESSSKIVNNTNNLIAHGSRYNKYKRQ